MRHLHLPPDLLKLIKEKNRTRKRARRTLDPPDRNRDNQFMNEVQTRIQNYGIAEWNSFTAALHEGDQKNLWKIYKRLRDPQSSTTRPLIQSSQGMVFTNSFKAEVFAEIMD